MPSHPDRVRTASLPEGYQFGDARPNDAAYPARGTYVDRQRWFAQLAQQIAAGLPVAPMVAGRVPDQVLNLPIEPDVPDAVAGAICDLTDAIQREGGVGVYCELELPEAVAHAARAGAVRVMHFWSVQKYRMVTMVTVGFIPRAEA